MCGVYIEATRLPQPVFEVLYIEADGEVPILQEDGGSQGRQKGRGESREIFLQLLPGTFRVGVLNIRPTNDRQNSTFTVLVGPTQFVP